MLTTIKQNEFINVSLKLQERQNLKSEGISVNGNEFLRITFKLIKW